MKRKRFSSSRVARLLRTFIWVTALTAIARDNNVTFSPTAPEGPDAVSGTRTLQISGTLNAEDGSCRKATVLFDGVELAGARVACSQPLFSPQSPR